MFSFPVFFSCLRSVSPQRVWRTRTLTHNKASFIAPFVSTSHLSSHVPPPPRSPHSLPLPTPPRCVVCRQFKPKRTEIVIDFNSINGSGMLNGATE